MTCHFLHIYSHLINAPIFKSLVKTINKKDVELKCKFLRRLSIYILYLVCKLIFQLRISKPIDYIRRLYYKKNILLIY